MHIAHSHIEAKFIMEEHKKRVNNNVYKNWD